MLRCLVQCFLDLVVRLRRLELLVGYQLGVLLADPLRSAQSPLGLVAVRPSLRGGRLRRRERRLCPLYRRFERGRVDDKQRVAGGHHLPFENAQIDYTTGYFGLNLHPQMWADAAARRHQRDEIALLNVLGAHVGPTAAALSQSQPHEDQDHHGDADSDEYLLFIHFVLPRLRFYSRFS